MTNENFVKELAWIETLGDPRTSSCIASWVLQNVVVCHIYVYSILSLLALNHTYIYHELGFYLPSRFVAVHIIHLICSCSLNHMHGKKDLDWLIWHFLRREGGSIVPSYSGAGGIQTQVIKYHPLSWPSWQCNRIAIGKNGVINLIPYRIRVRRMRWGFAFPGTRAFRTLVILLMHLKEISVRSFALWIRMVAGTWSTHI